MQCVLKGKNVAKEWHCIHLRGTGQTLFFFVQFLVRFLFILYVCVCVLCLEAYTFLHRHRTTDGSLYTSTHRE